MWDVLKSEYVIEKIGFYIKININYCTNGYKCSYKKKILNTNFTIVIMCFSLSSICYYPFDLICNTSTWNKGIRCIGSRHGKTGGSGRVRVGSIGSRVTGQNGSFLNGSIGLRVKRVTGWVGLRVGSSWPVFFKKFFFFFLK